VNNVVRAHAKVFSFSNVSKFAKETMFKGWTFHVETDVNSSVRTLIERYDGSMTESKESATCCLVDANFILRNESNPNDDTLLLAHWVLACHLKGCVVDKKPFLAAYDKEKRSLKATS
jgi:hypothetical protein